MTPSRRRAAVPRKWVYTVVCRTASFLSMEWERSLPSQDLHGKAFDFLYLPPTFIRSPLNVYLRLILKILAISRLPSYLPISPNLQNRRARVQWGIWRPSRDARRVRHKYPSMEIGVRGLVAGMLRAGLFVVIKSLIVLTKGMIFLAKNR